MTGDIGGLVAKNPRCKWWIVDIKNLLIRCNWHSIIIKLASLKAYSTSKLRPTGPASQRLTETNWGNSLRRFASGDVLVGLSSKGLTIAAEGGRGGLKTPEIGWHHMWTAPNVRLCDAYWVVVRIPFGLRSKEEYYRGGAGGMHLLAGSWSGCPDILTSNLDSQTSARCWNYELSGITQVSQAGNPADWWECIP